MKIQNLTKVYKTEYELVKALDDMTLDLPQKGLVFIVGVSGSGKSTLMNMLSGVDRPTSGDVIVGDKSLFSDDKKQLFGYRNSYVGLIFQDYNLIEDLNVYDNIKLPLEFLDIKDYSIIDEVIKKVDIEDIKYSKVTEISSGQMQRVAIARALVKDSAMILADEPTGNLDSKNTKIVMDLLKDISKDRLVVVITHDDDAAHEYGDRIIAIEDGHVLSDTTINEAINIYDPSLEKSTDFKKPDVTFSQQLKFTTGFIRNSLARSRAIFIMLILIPVIGSILCGYAYFDIATSYYDYQEKYGSNYVKISNEKSGYSVYYSEEEYFQIEEKYNENNLYELYSTYIPIAERWMDASSFYQPVIYNIVVDNTNKIKVTEGEYPALGNVTDKAEIAITDYIQASYEFYYGERKEVGDYINICGEDYEIIGIISTNYKDFLRSDFSNDLERLAFEENLSIYNAVYTSFSGVKYIMNHRKYFVEEVKYNVYPKDGNGQMYSKTGYVAVKLFNTTDSYRYIYGDHYSFTSSEVSDRYCMASQTMWEDFLTLDKQDIRSVKSFTFICFSTNRYSFSGYLAYVYKNDVDSDIYGVNGEVVVKENMFKKLAERQSGCRFLIEKDSSIYDEVLKNENVVNASFAYAKATWERCSSSKYVMIEFLITMIVIMMVFAYIINSMTLNIEKKKIGIKYSFGISKFPIIVPYLIETIMYIITGIIISLVIIKVVYPVVVTNLVYTSTQELLEYEFFYISNMNIFKWDLIIYSIMIISLTIMVLSICRKSPIEIIKDL